jgi:hypothetical protein
MPGDFFAVVEAVSVNENGEGLGIIRHFKTSLDCLPVESWVHVNVTGRVHVGIRHRVIVRKRVFAGA